MDNQVEGCCLGATDSENRKKILGISQGGRCRLQNYWGCQNSNFDRTVQKADFAKFFGSAPLYPHRTPKIGGHKVTVVKI